MKKIFFILLVFLFSCSSKNEIFDIKLLKLNNEEFSLATAKNNQLTVFYFLAPECPLSQNYTKAINEIYDEFSPKNVKFHGVFCGRVYSEDEMSKYVSDYDISMTCLKDVNYELSEKLNATITPEVFVVANMGEIIYSGKIDNWAESLGIKRQIVTKFFLKDALNQYLNGEPVLVAKTEAVGCILE